MCRARSPTGLVSVCVSKHLNYMVQPEAGDSRVNSTVYNAQPSTSGTAAYTASSAAVQLPPEVYAKIREVRFVIFFASTKCTPSGRPTILDSNSAWRSGPLGAYTREVSHHSNVHQLSYRRSTTNSPIAPPRLEFDVRIRYCSRAMLRSKMTPLSQLGEARECSLCHGSLALSLPSTTRGAEF